MTRQRRLLPDAEPPRPPCASCGAPATCEAELVLRDLVLERDAGVRSRPYWSSDYKAQRARVATRLCDACVSANVRIATSIVCDLDASSVIPQKKGP